MNVDTLGFVTLYTNFSPTRANGTQISGPNTRRLHESASPRFSV